jgi:hypothetical protein
VLAYLFGGMGDVELDRPATTGLQVNEQQPVLRPEQIAGVRLAVQQLLGGATLADRPTQPSQRAAQKLPVCIAELGSVGAVVNQPLRFGDSIGEVWRSKIDPPHASVQAIERLRVLG